MTEKKEGKIMGFIVATNVVASQPPERRPIRILVRMAGQTVVGGLPVGGIKDKAKLSPAKLT